MEQPLLRVDGLSILFGDLAVVDALSFSLEKGRTLAMVGESGSGKSLSSLALMGLLPPQASVQGSAQLNGRELFQLNKQEWRQLRGPAVSMVFQEPMSALNPVMTIGRQLEECFIAHERMSAAQRKELATEWLRKMQLPDPEAIADRYPHQLSGGQKQRVMIAMALCNHPDLLIADEPTTALDVTVQAEILKLMKSLQAELGLAMIFITHDLALAAEVADEVLVLFRGERIEYGPAAQVLTQPREPYTKALLASRPKSSDKGRRLLTVADVLQGATGQGAPWEPPSAGEPLLRVEQLDVWFPKRSGWFGPEEYTKAVSDFSFAMDAGETLGLVGESGSGKSTVGRALVGLQTVRSGNIYFKGQEIGRLSDAERKPLRTRIQLIFQDPYASLNPRLKIREIVGEPMRAHGLVPARGLDAAVAQLLDHVQLPASAADKYPHEFSGGQRQRIGIARALGLKPELLICDESLASLDVSIQAQTLNLLHDLQHEFSLSYLFISHDLNLVYYFCDRILVMKSGKLVEEGSAETVLRSPRDPYTQRLIAAMPDGRSKL